MGRTREEVRRAFARAFNKAGKHQRAIDPLWAYTMLGAITVAAVWLWFHRSNPRIVIYATDLIPGVLSILIAFIPDLRKQHMAWRISILVVGIIGSVLLWKKEALSEQAEAEAITAALQQANNHSDQRLDQQTSRLKVDLTKHSDAQITEINNKIETTTTSVLDAFSRTASKLDQRIDGIKPAPAAVAKMVFSFFDTDSQQFPVVITAMRPDEQNVVEVPLTFRNTSAATAKDLEVWIQVCDACTFAQEPSGFEKLSGMAEVVRHRRIGDLHSGVTFEKITTRVKIRPGFNSISLAFSYACDNCGPTLPLEVQRITAIILR